MLLMFCLFMITNNIFLLFYSSWRPVGGSYCHTRRMYHSTCKLCQGRVTPASSALPQLPYDPNQLFPSYQPDFSPGCFQVDLFCSSYCRPKYVLGRHADSSGLQCSHVLFESAVDTAGRCVFFFSVFNFISARNK